MLHMHLTIFVSFLPSLLRFFSLTGQNPYSIMLHTHTEYNLYFAPKGKPLPAKKGTESLNLHHLLLILLVIASYKLSLNRSKK